MTQDEAIRACEYYGMHLPTLFELVSLEKAHGITIIRAPGETRKQELSPSHQKTMIAKNPDGKMVIFDIDFQNYVSPEKSLGDVSFWTSSKFSDPDPNKPDWGVTLFEGWYFDSVDQRVTGKSAVRCVADE